MQAIHTYLGEENVKEIVNFTLRYVADLDIPIKRLVYGVKYFTGKLTSV